ncbi:MAG: hypothetical protein Kow00108_02880 [Calditrichia bacterium]
MITLKEKSFKIEEVSQVKPLEAAGQAIAKRPDVVDAKVYKLKSGFVKHSVYVTLGYIRENNTIRPIEIFINSKDLTKAAEYAVLTRLISAIFRKSSDPTFILEELKSIYDPNGGYLKKGKYVHSFYSEIADVIEQFFVDIGRIDKTSENNGFHQELQSGNSGGAITVKPNEVDEFKICPECQDRTLKFENGCEVCVNPECGYSKCDK